jgi:hypothetical protein
MTRHEIFALIKQGWETKGYISGSYTERGNYGPLKDVECVCALGAAAFAAGYHTAGDFAVSVEGEDWNDITSISDASFSKVEAIENLEKWADRA